MLFKSVVQKTKVTFHTEKGCCYITSKENWNHAFLHTQKEYFLAGLSIQNEKKKCLRS